MSQEINKKRTQAGFTFVEMMISMTVFLIAAGAIFGLLKISTIQKKTASTRTDQLKGARIALEYVRRDALNAGFGYHRTGGNVPDNMANKLFSLPNDTDAERDLLTAIVAGSDLTDNTLNPGVKMDFVAFMSRDPKFNGGKQLVYTSASNVGSGSSIYLNTDTNGAASATVNDMYLIEPGSGTTQVIGMVTSVTGGNKITLGSSDPLSINQSATGTGENLNLLMTANGEGIVKKINIVSYGVTSDGILVRKTYGNQTGANQVETRELVFGVKDFQVRYFMENGAILDNPSSNHSGRDNQQKLNNIVQIQISVTIQPNEDAAGGAPATPVTIKEYISTRNLRYEAS